ncbi:MAG: MopE-related protein, partial [Myxococcota bacterium]
GMGQFCDSLQGCTDRPTPSDGGTTDGGGRDTGVDAGVDTAPDPCDGVVCEGFTRCVGGSCEPFPGCFSDAECPGELSLCRNNNCVPGDLDIDGDGSPAAEDCNEADPNISPLAMELCNLMDEDCDEMIDEGNPGLLCADDPMGGECIDGACGCPPNQYDVDGVADNGCECTATPAMGMGMACGAPINLGDVRDDGQMQMVTGNLVPAGREIWYQFRAIDAPDTSCDNFHVDVRFMTNPDDTYRFNVFQGTCDSAVCPASGFTGFSWATDFRETLAGRRTGECPCTASSVNTTNVSKCSDNSQTYFLQVVRRMGAAVTCAPFEIQISNGLFDT